MTTVGDEKRKNFVQNGDEDLLVHWKTIEIAKKDRVGLDVVVGLCFFYFKLLISRLGVDPCVYP